MDAAVFRHLLRDRLARRPFVPFEIRMADGRTIAVRDPGRLLLSPGGSTFVTIEGGEAWKVIQVDQVSTLTSTSAW